MAENLRAARRAGRPEDLQPLSERVGDGLQHAVQDVEALRVQWRHRGPVHHLLAEGHQGARRDPRPVPPRDRPRARRSSTCSTSSRPRRSTATCRATSTGSACATASTHAPTPTRARHAVLLDARLPGDLARRLEGRDRPPDPRRMGPLRQRQMGALPHRGGPLRAARSRRRGARAARGDDQPVVRRGRAPTRASRSTTARRWRSSSRRGLS